MKNHNCNCCKCRECCCGCCECCCGRCVCVCQCPPPCPPKPPLPPKPPCPPKPPKPPKPEPKPIPTSVTDIDNNVYQVKRFGNILWMAENLRVTRYDTESPLSGDTIAAATYNHTVDIGKPYYIDARDFEELPYTESLTNEIRNSLGFLYNWSAAAGVAANNTGVKDSIQGICPNGWRLPCSKDFNSLFYYLGGQEVAGQKLKSMYGWYTQSGSGTNESRLNCYPAGSAANNFVLLVGKQTMFWSTTIPIGDITRAVTLKLFYDKEEAETPNINKFQANSVRCVMDITNEYQK